MAILHGEQCLGTSRIPCNGEPAPSLVHANGTVFFATSFFSSWRKAAVDAKCDWLHEEVVAIVSSISQKARARGYRFDIGMEALEKKHALVGVKKSGLTHDEPDTLAEPVQKKARTVRAG